MKRRFSVLALVTALSACTMVSAEMQPVPITASNETVGTTVVRRPVPEPVPLPMAAGPPALSTAAALPRAIVVPPNTQYVCVTGGNGERQQGSIEFPKEVADLCKRHPEMGPCKYERDACRRSNGRVYAANGVESTKQTEAEYDRRVMRVEFKSN